MDLGIKGRVALVTGAGGGIGRVCAVELAREGCHLILADRTEALVADVAQEIKALKVEALTVGTNLETAEGVTRMMERAFEVFGHVDILFNNAGHNRDNT
ncbi:MAG: SDR family NAD(P)-dependent oxidoreductase, partial [Deltaproteobacteria bacterium]|nr:SDR family NAD(P)-dependent oxidoreductase [Deltaproteobacteria bacterium]